MTILYGLLLIVFGVVAWRDIRYALFILLAALPAYLLRFSAIGIPLTVLEGMILIIFSRWLILFWQKKETLQLDMWLKLAMLLFFLAGIVGTIVSPEKRAALGILKAYIIEPMLFFITARSVLKKQDIPKVITALSVSAIVISLYGLAQRFLGVKIVAPWQAELRITSLFEYPNAVGLFLAPLIPLFVWQLVQVWHKLRLKLYWLLVIILSLLAIYFAKTWGAMVALVAVGLAIGLWQKPTRKYAFAFLIGGIVAVFLASATRTIIIQKLSFKSWSGMVRVAMYEETWQMLKSSPVFGAGLNGYQTAIRPYHVNKWMEIFLYPHNIVLAVWSELGFLGLVAAIGLLLWFIKQLLQRRDSIRVMLVASMAIILIHGLVDVPYFKNDLAVIFWLLLALV